MDLANQSSKIFLHQNIKCLRKRLKLSQEELANRVGLNRGNIASYENGTAEPKICNLLKFSHLFKISIVDLTQKNLSKEASYESASSDFAELDHTQKAQLEQFKKKSEEITTYINSLHCCHQFKTKAMDDMPKETQLMLMHFEQLYEASQMLARNHKALIDFINCKM
ncbi:MAG: helix-turn-helix transcriptional regulator [Bacteroidota bacterium]